VPTRPLPVRLSAFLIFTRGRLLFFLASALLRFLPVAQGAMSPPPCPVHRFEGNAGSSAIALRPGCGPGSNPVPHLGPTAQARRSCPNLSREEAQSRTTAPPNVKGQPRSWGHAPGSATSSAAAAAVPCGRGKLPTAPSFRPGIRPRSRSTRIPGGIFKAPRSLLVRDSFPRCFSPGPRSEFPCPTTSPPVPASAPARSGTIASCH